MTEHKGIRKGFTKLHQEDKKLRDYVITLHNQGYPISSIRVMVNREYPEKDFGIRGISAFIKSYTDDIGSSVGNSDQFKERIINEFANVLSGLNQVQTSLMTKFNEAIAENDTDSIAVYAKLINDNIKTAHDVLGKYTESQLAAAKPEQARSFGQFIEKVKIDTKKLADYNPQYASI